MSPAPTSTMTARFGRSAGRRDRGAASLELLAIFPIAIMFAIVALQVGAFMWAVTSTNEAARQGARAQSLGQDGCAAARATLSDSLTVTRCTASGGRGPYQNTQLNLTVAVPNPPVVGQFLPDMTVDRTVRLP